MWLVGWDDIWRLGLDTRVAPMPRPLIGLAAVDRRHYTFHAFELRERQDQRYATHDIPFFGEMN
jgi:hypothetical protein